MGSAKRLGLAILLLAAVAAAQHSTTKTNPFDTPADRAEGAVLFRKQCAACHGPDGSGGASGPSLTGPLRRSDSDESLFQIVAKGLPGMPAFPGSGREMWQIVAYVRSLSVGKAAERSKGDPARGARIVEANGCRKCHVIGGSGGALGPDLGNIAALRTPGSLRRSILRPNEEVSPDYWRLRARTKSGAEIAGVRMNEDTYSFQYRTADALKSVAKADLAEYEIVRTSPMPSFEGKLSSAELDDLIAFLAAQKERVQ